MGDKSKEICISIDDVRRYMGEETSDLVKKFFKSEPKVEKKHDKDIDQNDKTKIQNIQSQECVLRNDRQKQREEIINQLVAQKHDGALSLRREEEEFQKLQMLETDFRNESMRLEKERLSVADGMKNAKKEEIEGLERQISQDLLQLEEQKNRIEEELSKKRTHIGSLRQNIRQVEKEIAENEVQRKADVDLAVHRQANTMDERQKQYLKHTSDYTHRVAENRAYALAAEQEKRLLESGDTKIFSHLVANPAKHSDLFTSEHVKLSKSDMHDIGGYSDEKGKVDNKQLLSELGIVNPELQAKLSENGLKQNADRLKSLKQEIHQANIANELELLNKQNGEAETPVVSSEFDSVGKGIAERLYNLKNGIPVDQPVSKDKPGKLLNMNDQLEMWLSDNGGHILNEKQQRGLSESTTGGAMQTPSSSSLQVGRVNAEPTLLSNVISSSTVHPVPTSRGGPLLTLEDMQAEIERLREEKRSKYLSELDRKEVEERGMKGRQVNHLNDIEDEPYFKAVRRHRGRQRGKGRRNKRSYDDSSSDGCSNGDEHGDMPNVLSNRSRSGGRKRRHRRDIPVNAYNQNQLGYEQAVLSQQYPMGAQLMSQYPPPMQAPPWQWNQQMHPWLQPQQAMHAPQQHFQPQLCVQQQQQQQPPSIKGAPVDNYPVLKSARDLETNDPFQNQSSNPVGAVNARKGAPLRLTRQEIKHQSELQALQFEMELLQKKQELETYRETLG